MLPLRRSSARTAIDAGIAQPHPGSARRILQRRGLANGDRTRLFGERAHIEDRVDEERPKPERHRQADAQHHERSESSTRRSRTSRARSPAPKLPQAPLEGFGIVVLQSARGLMYAGFLDLTQPLYFTIDGVLSPSECALYRRRFDDARAEVGTVIGVEGEVVDLEVRNNTRVMWDDAGGSRLAVREDLRAGAARLALDARGEREPSAADLSLRAGRASRRTLGHGGRAGERRRTLLTYVVYLNDDFEGGATEFPELRATIAPVLGRALLFQHRVVHLASDVVRGTKYVLRTDIIYEPID